MPRRRSVAGMGKDVPRKRNIAGKRKETVLIIRTEFSSVIFGGLITVFIKSILDAATIFVVELFDEVNVILFGIGHAVYEDCDKVIKIEEQRKQQALTFKNPNV